MKATSPAASGPAGSEFEAQVGASYLLTMLVAGEPRGLPNTVIDRVELQRAAEGHPLDDVIVHAHDAAGKAAVLEIQVKRSISFAPSDDVFQSVVGQMVAAAQKPGFWDAKHELAVATARTSRKIDGAYQDVLTWARQIGTFKVFAERIARPGSASDDMRTFVYTFKSHLEGFGYPHDDETVWRLLRRFQILIFDYTATGSASEALARERAARAMQPSDAGRGGNLWTALVALAIKIAASGGDRSRDTLRADSELASYALVGELRHVQALTALVENGSAALADIRDQINGVSIGRQARIAEVRENLENGRYIEIRGDAGVGKSGILKHFALQAAAETGIVVLKPGRTIPKGWTAMREALGFEGAATDLLRELAADGSGVLFIDNLDFFSADEQATVNDLIRAAAVVPGLSVIATARRNFGVNELGWLAQDGLDQLGRTAPIIINELDDDEIKEMAAAAPLFAGLLAASHPARGATHNLFRLARLASRSADAPVLRTETDMATEWWETADGPPEGRRERERALKYLAEQAFGAVAVFDVSGQAATVIDSLVEYETLQDYGGDRVGFRHDVFREWAVAKYLDLDTTSLERLPLEKPAPAYLARSLELYARSLIERATDDRDWSSLLGRMSQPQVHATWRRAILLALVRTEAASTALQAARPALLINQGALLNELIRTTTAVDSEPAREALAGSSINVDALPESLMIPIGPSWSRLILWILQLGDDVPSGSIPDTVDLFAKWSTAMLGTDPLTPRLLARLHHWLSRIEAAHDENTYTRPPIFEDALSTDQVWSLEEDLRRVFAMFADRAPALAAEYLRTAKDRRRREDIVTQLHQFRGSLPQAAPQELAALFEVALIPAPRPPRSGPIRRGSYEDRVFTHFDAQYLPVSPAQGPFYDLLVVSPDIGKKLIRRLVDYAVESQTRQYKGEIEAIVIATESGPHRFTWPHTFWWSREHYSTFYAVSSGLMALEAWAHGRVEAGETVETVVAGLLGEGDIPAAYLLVVIDVILSHWPSSKESAIPYVGNPELLILDRQREARERSEIPDIMGIKELQREPFGRVTAKQLSDRPSRDTTLYDHLKYYTFGKETDQRDRLVSLLQAQKDRLPEPDRQANYGDPEFMVRHALNLLDPANWSPCQLRLTTGQMVTGQEYVPPKEEADHLAPFQAEANQNIIGAQMQELASKALNAPGQIASNGLNLMVDWAMAKPDPAPVENAQGDRDNTVWSMRETMINIAVVAMRDGDFDTREKARAWAHGIISERLSQPVNRMGGSHSRIQFNPLALSFVGLAFSLRDQADEAVIRQLLQISGHDSSMAAAGFGASVAEIAQVDHRLVKSILRCALSARLYYHRNWDLKESHYEAHQAKLRSDVQARIAQELDWLGGRGAEPNWPDFPLRHPSAKRGIRIGGHSEPAPSRPKAKHELCADSQGAAAWLSGLRLIARTDLVPWLRDLIDHFRNWTSDANGSALDDDMDVERAPDEWNDAYFGLMTACLPGLTKDEVDRFALQMINDLAPNAALNASAKFLRSLDVIYFDYDTIDAAIAVHIRQSLAQSLRDQRGWERFARNRTPSVETKMGDTVSAVLFHSYNYGFAPPKCYLVRGLIDKMTALLPVIQAMAIEAPTILVATETMNLFELAPNFAQLPFLLAIGKAWIAERPDDILLWIDYSIGSRLCQAIDRLIDLQPQAFQTGTAERIEVDGILAALVRTGVSEAGQLELKIARLLS